MARHARQRGGGALARPHPSPPFPLLLQAPCAAAGDASEIVVLSDPRIRRRGTPQVYFFPSGQVEAHHADGSKDIRFPDGATLLTSRKFSLSSCSSLRSTACVRRVRRRSHGNRVCVLFVWVQGSFGGCIRTGGRRTCLQALAGRGRRDDSESMRILRRRCGLTPMRSRRVS